MDTSTELRLGLPGTEESVSTVSVSVLRGNKRPISGDSDECNSRFVGWPPVRTFRKNKFQCRPKITKCTVTVGDTCTSSPGLFVKVGMDGVPYLRKIDLKVYTGYKELRQALDTEDDERPEEERVR
ncbi:Auxin-responsive protein IAA31 [Zostera marina]|uniref:Auxin-responsive protein n=1 Tax=Zostera marina TaxID=29655 RepID=A0A0K9NHD7_ZOSMR|nr:Auxin-responsive protein IAA31 [Zostera marina]